MYTELRSPCVRVEQCCINQFSLSSVRSIYLSSTLVDAQSSHVAILHTSHLPIPHSTNSLLHLLPTSHHTASRKPTSIPKNHNKTPISPSKRPTQRTWVSSTSSFLPNSTISTAAVAGQVEVDSGMETNIHPSGITPTNPVGKNNSLN